MNKVRYYNICCIAACVIYFFMIMSAQINDELEASAISQQPTTVVIDAGHGGEDGGAVSSSGIRESAINLQIALKLEKLLAFCGIDTYMIRSADVSVYTQGQTIRERKISDLKERTRIVNELPNAILLSIHQNHFSEKKYKGAQVFYASSPGSKELATLSQNVLRQAVDPSNLREIKRAASVYLMENVRCTAILVECGFLSNPQECLNLQSEQYQKRMVCALSCALAQYLDEENCDYEI